MKSEDKVYEKLKLAIRRRFIKQGSKLGEEALAAQLGVSRTPVRSAIKRLEKDGLAYSIANRGAFVITPTREEIEQTFAVRTTLECRAMELAIERAEDSELAAIQELIEREHLYISNGQMEDFWVNNEDIHVKIAELSGNEVLVHYVHELVDRSSLYLVLYDPFSQLEYSPVSEHEKIYQALTARNKKEARLAMEEHLKSSLAYMHLAEERPEGYLSVV